MSRHLKISFLLLSLLTQSYILLSQDLIENISPIVKNDLVINKKEAGKLEFIEKTALNKQFFDYEKEFISKLKKVDKKSKITYKKIDCYAEVSELYPIFSKLEPFKTRTNSTNGIKDLSIESGLPSNRITKIIERRNGEIWGLAPGSLFCLKMGKILEYNTQNNLPDIYFQDIIEYNGKIYLASFGKGLFIFDNGKLENYSIKTGFPSDHLLHFEILNNQLFIGTYGKGLLKLDKDLNVFEVKIPELESSNSVISNFTVSEKELFLFNDYGIVIMNDNECYQKVSLGVDFKEISASYYENENSFWFANNNKLYHIFNDSIYAIKSNQLNDITTITKGKSGNIIVGYRDGVLMFSPYNYAINYGENNSLLLSNVSHIFQDRYSNVWCSTLKQGIILIQPSNFINILNDYPGITSISEGENNSIVFENKDGKGGLNILANNVLHKYSNENLRDIRTIKYDKANKTFWVLTPLYLYKIDENKKVFSYDFSFTDGRGTGNHVFFNISATGEILISSMNAGFIVFKNEKAHFYNNWYDKNHTYDKFTFSSNNGEIVSISATNNIGVINNKTNTLKIYKKEINGRKISFYQGLPFENDSLIFSSNDGVYILYQDKLSKWNIDPKIDKAKIVQVDYDKQKKVLWLVLQKSLAKYDLNNKTVNYYSTITGLNSSVISSNRCEIGKSSYWSTSNGIVQYLPFQFAKDTLKKELIIENFYVYDNDLKIKNKEAIKEFYSKLENNFPLDLKLPHTINNIEIVVGAYNWGFENATQLYYRLNQNDNWIPVDNNEGLIRLFDLQPNDYKLEIKASFLNYEDSFLTLNFTIKPPFYKTTWFLALLIIIVILAAYLFFKNLENFNFDRFDAFSENKLLIQKIRILGIANILFLIVFDGIFGYLTFTTLDLYIYAIVLLVTALLFAYTYVQKVSYKWLTISYRIAFIGLIVTYVFRAFVLDFPFHISVEIAVASLYLIFVFKDIKNILLSSLGLVSVSALLIIVSEASRENSVFFLYAVLIGLLGAVIYTLIETKKLKNILFSDKLLSSSNQFVLVADKNGNIVYCNNHILKTFGLKENEVLKDGWYKFRNYSVEKIAVLKKYIAETIQNNTPKESYLNVINYNGSNIHIKWRDTIVEGKFVLAIGEDITNEIIQKEKLDKLNADNKLINELGKEITGVKKINELITSSFNSINNIIGIKNIHIGYYQEADQVLVFQNYLTLKKSIKKEKFSLSDDSSLAIKTFKSGAPLLENQHNEYKYYLPLVKGNNCIGVLIVNTISADIENTYTQELIENLSLYISTALDNVLLYLNQEQKIIERTASLDQAYQNAKVLGGIIEKVASQINIKDINRELYYGLQKIMDLNSFGIGLVNKEKEIIEWFDYYENEVVYPYTTYNINDDTRLAYICITKNKTLFISDYETEYSKYFKNKTVPVIGAINRSIIYLPLVSENEVIGCLTIQNTKPNSFSTYHLDILKNIKVAITNALKNANFYSLLENKVAERTHQIELQNKELEKLSLVATKVTNGVVIANGNNEIQWANDSFLRMMGYSLDEIIGKIPMDTFSGPKTEKSISRTTDDNGNLNLELILYSKTGSEIWTLINITKINDENGKLIQSVFVITDITERKKQSEQYSFIVNNASEIIYTTNFKGNFEFISSSVTSILGFNENELVGKHFSILVDETHLEMVTSFYREIIRTNQTSSSLEFLCKTKNKGLIWVTQSVKMLKDEQGNISFLGIVKDINTEKLNQIEFEKKQKLKEKCNKLLYELSIENLKEYDSIHSFIQNIINKVSVALNIDRMSYWTYDEDRITCKVANDLIKKNSLNITLSKKDFPNYFHAIENEIYGLFNDAQDDKRLNDLKDYLIQNNITAMLDFGIRQEGKLIGVICNELTEKKRIFNEVEVEFFKGISELISLSIQVFKNYEKEEIIRQNEMKFRLLNESIEDVFWLIDLENLKMEYISPNCYKLFGCKENEYYNDIGIYQKYIYKDDLPIVNNAHQNILKDNFYEIEYRVTVNNEMKWIKEKSYLIRDENGNPIKSSGVSIDITNQKIIDQEIKQLSLVAEKTSNGVTIADEFGAVLWANQSYLDMFEISFEELVGKQPKELFSGDDVELHEKLNVLNKTTNNYQLEILAQTYTKKPIWIELNTTLLEDSYGKKLQVEVINNITERKNRELLIQNQNHEILASIRYAQRIQNALLTSKEYLDKLPIDYMLYYRPKDIIGGDFYWMYQINEIVIIAIGDCTGHGVPGAIMTSLGINGLINAVVEMQFTDPALILNYLDNYILSILSTSTDNEVNDGMDIGIIHYNTLTKEIIYSGAGRPLIIEQNKEIKKIQGSKKSIGSNYFDADYFSESIQGSESATYYLFSDGVVDQFGGVNKRRLGSKRLNDFFIEMSEKSNKIIETEFKLFFENHKGSNEQTDDVVFFSFKIK